MILRRVLLVTLALLLGLVTKPALAKAKKAAKSADPPVKGTTEKTVPLRTHSLYAPYVDSDLQNRWWDFGGDSYVNTAKHIRLTQDRKSQSGWLWSRLPLTPTSFEIEFEFRVDGKSNGLFGDGFAMWLTRQRAQAGPVFGNQDRWDGLAILFDTYANSRHSYTFPQIMAIMNDGTKIYDVGKDGAGQEIARCSIDYRRTEVTAKGKLTYFKNQFLELQIQHERWDQWTTCFTAWNITLPGQPFLGFSAHTGDVSDEHDIASVATSNVVYHPPALAGKHGRTAQSSGLAVSFFGLLMSLVKWALIASVLGAAAIVARRAMVKRNSKRF